MVVLETKSQIMEVDGHETAIVQQYKSGSHINNSEHLSAFFKFPTMFLN